MAELRRVLLLDDDPLILNALRRVLEAQRFEVVAFSDAQHALEELRTRPVSLIISDYMMPGMNGVEFLTRARELCPDIPRLMLTAANDFQVATEAVNSGEVYRLLAKPWTVTELLAIVLQAHELGELRRDKARLIAVVEERSAELQRMNRDLQALVQERTNNLLEGMVSALDYRDTETQWHSRRVALYAKRLAEALGITGEELLTVEMGALLHDIGKIGVRDSVLLKPGPLTPDEWVEMKEHPAIGFRLLSGIPYLKDASQIVLQHQEKWDGTGYPSGRVGESIVIGARIFAVVDTLDAIRSDRPYRAGRPFPVALAELHRCAGTQFDPAVVEAFCGVVESAWEEIRDHVERLSEEAARREGADGLGVAGRSWQPRKPAITTRSA